MTPISFCKSRSIWFRSSPPSQEDKKKCSTYYLTVLNRLVFGLTSGDLHIQGSANQSHESGGEVDGHVLVHWHVHQDKSLMVADRIPVRNNQGCLQIHMSQDKEAGARSSRGQPCRQIILSFS